MRRLIFLSALMVALGVSGEVSTRDYVHDGLIAYWDARFSGGASNKWTDLVDGRSFELHDVTRSAAELVFNGTASSYAFLSAEDTAAVFEGHTNHTFEIVAKYPNVNSGGLFKSTAASGVAVRFVDGNRFFCCGSNRPRFGNYSFKNIKITLAVTYTKGLSQSCYANGNTVGPSSVEGSCPGDFGGTYLGQMGNGSSPFNGKVYAIRVYNRHLTQAEIQANAALDAEWQFKDIESNYVRVEASPERVGVPTPDYGLIENLSVGDPIDLAAPPDETDGSASGQRYACTGWTFTGTNAVQLSGQTKTASFAFAESGVFRWRLDIEHRVAVVSPVYSGTASASDGGWAAAGGTLTLTATPADGASFYGWKNEVGEVFSSDNPLVLTVDRPMTLTPVFRCGSQDPDAVPNSAVRTSGASAPAPLDLSSLWLPTNLEAIAVAYSSVGWDIAEASAPAAAVDLDLAQVGQVVTKVLANGLTGRSTFAWTPEEVERTALYDLTHVVKVSGVTDQIQTLTAHFSFANAKFKATEAEIVAAVRAEVSQPFVLMNNGGDADVRWEPFGGAAEGLVAPYAPERPNPGVSTLDVAVSGPGRLTFDVRLDGGTLAVRVDGVLLETVTSAADWTEKTVNILSRGEHHVTLEASVAAEGQAFVTGLRLQQDDVTYDSAVGDPARVDLREGVRVLHDRAELLPFTYSQTNFTGFAGATAESIARVSVAQLAPDEPTDDLSLWTNAVVGTERVLRREAGESSAVWRGRAGVWRATFDILNGENVLKSESAVFDLRDLRGGFVILLR